ncbi:TRAF-interacting protein with FHA domain-containing protein A [Synchiropus picturatus]
MLKSKAVDTEEDLLTSLDVQIYHPQQSVQGMFCHLPVGTKVRLPADEPLKLGRDEESCTFVLNDPKVSRKQLSLHAYRPKGSQEMRFTIQNLSQKARLVVNGCTLDHLERLDLPDKALVRFGLYELLIVRESGEAKGSVEVKIQVPIFSLLRESGSCDPKNVPVMETSAPPATLMDYHGPLEMDETLLCTS